MSRHYKVKQIICEKLKLLQSEEKHHSQPQQPIRDRRRGLALSSRLMYSLPNVAGKTASCYRKTVYLPLLVAMLTSLSIYGCDEAERKG